MHEHEHELEVKVQVAPVLELARREPQVQPSSSQPLPSPRCLELAESSVSAHRAFGACPVQLCCEYHASLPWWSDRRRGATRWRERKKKVLLALPPMRWKPQSRLCCSTADEVETSIAAQVGVGSRPLRYHATRGDRSGFKIAFTYWAQDTIYKGVGATLTF